MNIKDSLWWIMIIAIFALGIYLVVYTQDESFKCISNPYGYPIELIEKSNNATVNCQCNIVTNKGLNYFTWDNKGITFGMSDNSLPF